MPKPTLLLLALSLACWGVATALPVEYGVKLGFNLAQHYGTKADDTEFKVQSALRPGFVGGVWLHYRLLEEVRLGYEILYSMKGSRQQVQVLQMEGETLSKPAEMNLRYDLDYIEMPILLRLRTLNKPRLALETIAGTAMSLKIKGHHELEGTFYLPDSEGFEEIPVSESSDLAYVNMFDYSFVYGFALQYHGPMELTAELRFTLGWDYLRLPTFSLAEPAELRNQTYSLILGAHF